MSFEAFNLSGGQYQKLFGKTLGPLCDIVYEKSLENELRSAFQHTNLTIPYGTCPFPAQTVEVKNYVPSDLGDYLPPYIPGNERWKVTIWISKDEEIISGMTVYSILRDMQKLFESKWKK